MDLGELSLSPYKYELPIYKYELRIYKHSNKFRNKGVDLYKHELCIHK